MLMWAFMPLLNTRVSPMAKDKMKSEDTVPQADKQAHTEIAQREGTEGAQAQVINKEEGQKKKDR
jgi:fructose-1,6-bisphosphatase/inositol monophosphatase family enzyme